jgi:hypothetical protein
LLKWFSISPEELRTWDAASDSFKLCILRRQVDELDLLVKVLFCVQVFPWIAIVVLLCVR